ncbi:MAG: nucleotidyltransferase domain-containing protein [Petrimonas sp.]|jgi:predicted nucleotidyltransferase
MDKAEAIRLAKSYKELITPFFPDNKIYLYGSYSTDKQKEDSDIDIAVIVNSFSKNYFDEVPLLWKIRRKVSTLIEPILLSSEDKNSPIYKEVIKNGILI